VVVVGGSQGAQSLNRAAIGAFGDAPPFTVIHSCGPANYEESAAQLALRDHGSRYRLEPYLDNLPEAIAAADLVVSRAGGSVFEIAAIGRPAILVPYPHATGDHQAKNAGWMAEAGAAVSLPDYACTAEKLRGLVGALLSDPRRLEAMSESARAIGRPEAAEVIAEAVLELAG
jgi:UDP-N-acetylglucosamine--N-acetylmuramyl-(pentapeptide) pyrophosphoryl-undecaprenol N-acetylglucosamine transferase